MCYMPEPTTRDRVWTVALTHTQRMDSVTTPEAIADETGASERMVRDALNVMAQNGFIRRDVKMDGSVRFMPTDSDS